jgi:hypothetical protein
VHSDHIRIPYKFAVSSVLASLRIWQLRAAEFPCTLALSQHVYDHNRQQNRRRTTQNTVLNQLRTRKSVHHPNELSRGTSPGLLAQVSVDHEVPVSHWHSNDQIEIL